jgi:membrane associated rhomboid family serine protease/DNA-binding GntR family transcriptional regulator
MLILPVGLDKNEVRRIPWVSATVIVACFLVQIVLSVGFADEERETYQRLGEAVEYLAGRPYLSGPPALLSLLGTEGQAALEQAQADWAASGAPVSPTMAAQQQAELNGLAEDAIGLLRRLPHFRFGFVPADPWAPALVTHAFLHGGWLHLIGNMLFLFLSGPFIEDLYGRPLFAGLYVAAAVAGAGAFAVGAPQSTVPLVGASGAIAGVMGAFLWRLAARRIRFLVLPVLIIPAFRFNISLPAFVVLPLWALQQLYYASTVGEDAGVAFSAHVGGFLAGLAFAVVVTLLRVEETVVAPAIEEQISLEQNPDIERASEARLAGDLATARRTIGGVLQAEPESLDAWIESWEIALEAEDGEDAGRAGQRLMDLLKRQGEQELLWDVAADARWRQLRMPSRFLFAVAGLYAGSGDGREAIEVYRRVSAQSGPDDVAGLRALVSEGEILARAGDPRAARQVFERARAHPACSEPWLERMESALRSSQPTRAARPRPRE